MSASKVLIVEDDAALREALATTLELSGHQVLQAHDGTQALDCLEKEQDVGLVLSDVQMEPMDGYRLLQQVRDRHLGLPLVLMTAYGSIDKAVAAMREGAADYLVKPFDAQRLLRTVDRFLASNDEAPDDGWITADPQSRRLRQLAGRVAQSDATVLVTGESGTGKEVLARFLHAHSPRAQGPFVAVNCAAIPETMLEATLFGHEKGAYTGAGAARAGKFEQADGGTLLLDEVTEMEIGLQAKLLRVLQEREVERLGGRRAIPLDVRVVATTNRDPQAAVAEGRLRQDLYYRLNVFPLQVPPLRERPDDIEPLARTFIERHGSAPLPELTPEAVARLRRHHWPGNVRELENVIQRALILAGEGRIRPEHLLIEGAEPEAAAPRLEDDLRHREAERIRAALAAGGTRVEAARRLGISPRTLRYKLARLREAGIDIG